MPSEATMKVYEYIEGMTELSPRVRKAALLYGSGAARTKKEASSMAGLHPCYLSVLRNSGAVQAKIDGANEEIERRVVDMSVLIQRLSERAIGHIAATMESEVVAPAIRLKAAIDLADRGPETSKTIKHEVQGMALGPADAKMIADAMVRAAEIRQANSHLVQGNHDRTGLLQEIAERSSVDGDKSGR